MGIRAVDSSEIASLLEEAIQGERQRILAIIETEPWEVYGEDYYRTFDHETSIAKLKSLILGEKPAAQ